MTLDELKEFLDESLASDYRIATDKRGQIIIYTAVVEDSDGELVSAEDVDEVDLDDLDEDDVDLDNLDEDEDA